MVVMIVITGASGRLGKELSKLFPDAATPTHRELDVTNEKNVSRFIQSASPEVVIHLAAMTSVTECETEKERAWKINVTGTLNTAKASAKAGAYFMLMSTPCVFSGKGPFMEDDTPYPENFYGLTKIAAEISVLAISTNSVIIRANFVPKEKWPYEGAFTDRWGTYLFAEDLAKEIKKIIDLRKTGVMHVAGDRIMSMYELAKLCPDSEHVKPISYTKYLENGGCRLTQDMTLGSNHWQKTTISA